MNFNLAQKLAQHGLLSHQDMGRVIWRRKESKGDSWIKHKGIVVGQDHNGELMVIHNTSTTNIQLVSLKQFARGYACHYQKVPCTFSPDRVATNAFYQLEIREPYTWLWYNCQHATSQACWGKRFSGDLKIALQRVGVALLIILLFILTIRASRKHT